MLSPAEKSIPMDEACVAIARAMGWSVPESIRAAASTTSRTSAPSAMTLTTEGFPAVNVPVLSNTMVSIRRVLSSTSVPRMMIPLRAPRPVPTRRAIGVASPRAHGHATTSVDTATASAVSTLPVVHHQPRPARAASTMTRGTNTAEIVSTVL
ncbi:unannotated protein [freshwater metagenome]|uniref:Unannotated protein n=1 Tax=freshwater metagenome TaxID=449393 RepID=A0A6J6FQN9_9ZZZZ